MKKMSVWAAAALALVATSVLSGQVQMCLGGTAPACQGVRGNRSEGWLRANQRIGPAHDRQPAWFLALFARRSEMPTTSTPAAGKI
jgi:hypothetical protein